MVRAQASSVLLVPSSLVQDLTGVGAIVTSVKRGRTKVYVVEVFNCQPTQLPRGQARYPQGSSTYFVKTTAHDPDIETITGGLAELLG